MNDQLKAEHLRHDNMQQHSGQHLVSAVLEKEHSINTMSWWMAENYPGKVLIRVCTNFPLSWYQLSLFDNPESQNNLHFKLKVGVSYIELDKLPSQEVLAAVEERCNEVMMMMLLLILMMTITKTMDTSMIRILIIIIMSMMGFVIMLLMVLMITTTNPVKTTMIRILMIMMIMMMIMRRMLIMGNAADDHDHDDHDDEDDDDDDGASGWFGMNNDSGNFVQ